MRTCVLFRKGVVIVKSLSQRQREVYDFVEGFTSRKGYPPTHEEIRQGLEMSTRSLVNHHLRALERKGFVERQPDTPRGIELLDGFRSFKVPVLGHIAAGEPVSFSDDEYEETELTSDIVKEQDGLYALRVKGDSTMDALINDGDVVVMRHRRVAERGQMVAVRLKDRNETTSKRFYPEGKQVRLQPANPRVKPMFVDSAQVEIQGKVMAVIRQVA
ncbi:MAG: transcriptional repressor LexA [Chloroflexi bacterium]|nr:transcriptional repressor LexA [Chloroflexota bacterium]